MLIVDCILDRSHLTMILNKGLVTLYDDSN